jgi:hypothetical protein
MASRKSKNEAKRKVIARVKGEQYVPKAPRIKHRNPQVAANKERKPHVKANRTQYVTGQGNAGAVPISRCHNGVANRGARVVIREAKYDKDGARTQYQKTISCGRANRRDVQDVHRMLNEDRFKTWSAPVNKSMCGMKPPRPSKMPVNEIAATAHRKAAAARKAWKSKAARDQRKLAAMESNSRKAA